MYTYTATHLEHKTFGELKAIARELNIVPSGDRRRRQSWIAVIADVQLPLLQLLEVSPGVELDRVQEPIVQAAQTFPGVEIEALALPESSDTLAASPVVEIEALAFPESSDTLAASPIVESEPVVLSDRFLAAYAPPQVQIHYQADADGQLSLFDFQVESVEEAPDPDDFESLDAFYEAIALLDSEHYQPLEISLDSFCEWAPCPDDWYEPAGENSPGVDRVQALERKNISGVDRVQALLKSSITSEFLIPVFEAWRDRPDEPPTAAVGARLPKPPNSPQTHSVTVCYSGRSPPGGDVIT